MADNTRDKEKSLSRNSRIANGEMPKTQIHKSCSKGKQDTSTAVTTTEYCEKLQEWIWQYYYSYMNWQSWIAMSALSFPPCFPTQGSNETSGATTWATDMSNGDLRNWLSNPFAFPLPTLPVAGNGAAPAGSASGQSFRAHSTAPAPLPQQQQQQQQQNGNAQQPGREYYIPSPLQRFLAEMVDFFILFFIKATIILSIVHFSGMKDISKFAMHFIVEEIDEDTSMEELQKMMLVALVYRTLVCFYEIICIWGAGGATPGKFLVGLRVVTCDSSVLVQPNRVLVVPATNVTLSASTVRALNKNFSIAFFFPAFITLLFFQHNRTVYDIVAGTIVVKRNRLR
ncbi:protein FAM8A1 [Triplophysa rosa]|uniref:Family with sequence similarity 8 n=1 Tax=Triplophysa rosa TaxID=992332 RepID=A0A9W7WQP5_TRIRA|nr:protein FAM8A1 [Triplophysa rosa]KAI7806587.1 family with sequence similarity 8 [Triplophysa rosa]